MNIKGVKTEKIIRGNTDIFVVLDKYLPLIPENSVVVVTSKIVSICEGRVVKIDDIDKDKLIEEESDLYLSRENNPHNVSFSIKNNILAPTAGIDESNGDGYYILWPDNPQESANRIREYLIERFGLKNVGVIITDSKTTPMRWGVTGFALAHSGFEALKDYVGEEDLFGRRFAFEKLNIADSLAASAVSVMGEGSEMTPIAVIEDIPIIKFQNRNPDNKELNQLRIDLDLDLYGPFLKNANWKKGKGR